MFGANRVNGSRGVSVTWRAIHNESDQHSEFCVSCHAMTHPQAEWEGSVHFSNRKGIRAQCADCHVPQDGLHYVKAKMIALKDVWYTITGKLPDQETKEKHR